MTPNPPIYPPASADIVAQRQTLSLCSVFAGLPPAALDSICTRLQVRTGMAGSTLIAQDEPGESLFIVHSGRIKVVAGDNGKEVTLAILRPGDVFGEVSMIDCAPRSASVVALTNAQVLVLSRVDFLQHMQSYPQTALNLMTEMARRLRRADEAIVGLALQDVEGRLRRTLVRLAREDGGSVTEGLVLRRRPTQQELANMVGSSRETVSRTISSMMRRGLIVPRGRALVLTEKMLSS